MCSAVNDPSFYWKNNCDYNGGNILIGYGIKSLIQCAKACFNHKDCNYFTFVAHTCSLKNMRYLSQSVDVDGSICGKIVNHIPKSTSILGRQWKNSEDGSYKWDTGCKYHANPSDHYIDRIVHVNGVAACAELCKTNPNCNYFDVRIDDECWLKEAHSSYTEQTSNDLGCGFIPKRAYITYNIERIPTCSSNSGKQNSTTKNWTTTTTTTTTTN